MEELIQTKLYDVLTQSCNESPKVITWRGKINPNDLHDWKIIVECVDEEKEYLIKIKKRMTN